MRDSDSIVVVRTPLRINLSAIRQLFPSLTFTSRRRFRRGDDNLRQAEFYVRVTEEQLNTIYNASQETHKAFAKEIVIIQDDLKEVGSVLNAIKTARSSQSTLSKHLSDHALTVDVLDAARELSEKAKTTSNIVSQKDFEFSRTNVALQTASSSDSDPIVSGDDLTAQTDICGIDFSFNRNPTEDDTKKIESIICLVDPQLYSDNDNNDGSIRVLRPRKSDLSTYSFHYWGPNAYAASESRSLPNTSNQLSPQSRISTGMQLGAHAAFHQCRFNILNIQSNDCSSISDFTSNLSADSAGQETPPMLSAVDKMQSTSERHSPAASSPQAQNNNPTVAMQSFPETHLDEVNCRRKETLATNSTITNASQDSTVRHNADMVARQSDLSSHHGRAVIDTSSTEADGNSPDDDDASTSADDHSMLTLSW